MVMIASEGSEKNRAVPSAPKPKTLKDCLIRNVSGVMRHDPSACERIVAKAATLDPLVSFPFRVTLLACKSSPFDVCSSPLP
jgi:hypothetical protein